MGGGGWQARASYREAHVIEAALYLGMVPVGDSWPACPVHRPALQAEERDDDIQQVGKSSFKASKEEEEEEEKKGRLITRFSCFVLCKAMLTWLVLGEARW